MSVKVFASSMVPRWSKAGHDRRRQLRRVGERLVCSPAVSCVRHAAHLLPHREVNLHFEPRALSSHALRARTRCRTTTAWRGSRWRTHVPHAVECAGGVAESPARQVRPSAQCKSCVATIARVNRPLRRWQGQPCTRARAHTHMPLRRRQGQPCLCREPRQRSGPIIILPLNRRSGARNGRLL